MLNFADKLFSITSSWVGPHSPDPLSHFPASTQVPQKTISQSEAPSGKIPARSSISHSISTTDIRSNLSPECDVTSNSLVIRSLLDSLQISLRVLVMQQPKSCAHKPPVVLFDSLDMTSCEECQQVFHPEQMSELIFGNCYITTPSGLKLQTLHSNCILLSRVIYHNAHHLVRSNQSSTQIPPPKLANSLNPQSPSDVASQWVRCKTATSRRNIEKELQVFNKPLSSSLDSKRPTPISSSPASSWGPFEESLFQNSTTRLSSHTRPVSVESLTSPHKSISKTRQLAIVLILHEKERHSPQINDILQSHFLSIENSINMLADNMYDVIGSTTEASFRPSLAVAVEQFLTDISSHLSHGNKLFSTLPLQLYSFSDCPLKNIPTVVAELHARFNCAPHMDNLLSRLLTAFFTYHHSWLVSLIQQADSSETLSSHIEAIASRYGYSPASPFLCKVLLVDQCNQLSQGALSQLIILFSYLFRYKLNELQAGRDGASPIRELTPSNEDFLIISMGTDVFNSPTIIQQETNTNNSNIQCYTYDPTGFKNTDATNGSYTQVPFSEDRIFYDIYEETRVPTNNSILNYTTSDRNAVILECLSELRDLYAYLESGGVQDELFSIEDNLYEAGGLYPSTPAPTLIIADLSELSVEVIHTDTSLVDWKFKESVLSKARPQKHSKLVHSLLETTSSIMGMFEERESGQEAQAVNNSEIALLCLENSLGDLHTKAALLVKHLKSWLEWEEQGIEDRARTHDLFSELISLLRVDLSDLELLLRLASVVAPEERSALERLITFLSAY